MVFLKATEATDFVPGSLLLFTLILFTALALLSYSVEEVKAEKEDAILIWNLERFDHKVAEGRDPVTFHMSVKVGSEREMVTAHYQVEGPKGWTNIFYSGDTEWDVGFWPEFWYIPGKEYRLNVTITPPYGALNASYWFVLRVHLEENESATDSVELGLIMRQYADFELVGPYAHNGSMDPPPGGDFSARPGEYLVNSLVLYNLGNGYDEFTIQAEFHRPTRGWSVEFIEGVSKDGSTPVLRPDPFKKWPYQIKFRVSIPEAERAGITNQVYFSATSVFNTSLERPSLIFSFTSLQVYDFDVHVKGLYILECLPLDEVVFELQLFNKGNGWDTFTIKPMWDVEQNPGFVASSDPRNADVSAWSGIRVRFMVKVPQFPPQGAYHFYVEVRSSSYELSAVTKTLTVLVGQRYAFEMYMEGPRRLETIPGGNLEAELVVHNSGNGLDRIVIDDLQGLPEGWLVRAQPNEVALLQDQEARLKVVIIVPSRREDARIGEYHLTVRAASSRSNATDQLTLVIEVVQYFRVEWSTDTLRPRRTFNPFEKDSISYTLELKNYGNDVDRVRLDSYSLDPRVNTTLDLSTIVLGPDEARSIKVVVRVDTSLPPGIYDVFVNATSQGPGTISRVLPIDFGIIHLDAAVPPMPTLIDDWHEFPQSVFEYEHGDNRSYKLKVENNGTRPLNGVKVRVFDIYTVDGEEVRWNFFNFTTPPIGVGDRYIVGARPFTPDNPPLYWWANRTGNHTLLFQVYYPHQSNTDNDVGIVRVKVLEPPDEVVEDGFRFPDVRWTIIGVLVIVVVSVTAFGLHQWIKEVKRPLRPW